MLAGLPVTASPIGKALREYCWQKRSKRRGVPMNIVAFADDDDCQQVPDYFFLLCQSLLLTTKKWSRMLANSIDDTRA